MILVSQSRSHVASFFFDSQIFECTRITGHCSERELAPSSKEVLYVILSSSPSEMAMTG